MNYGFVIDNRSCIGCHACSTACKAENEVPLGVNRTWVKYVDKGAWPHSRRHFQVTRCNHCANPPCVSICPVTAMYQRADGIVEFDGDACIGCKACLQACPYDAIYIDPDSGTAAKCHYCAHRTELELEPACVVVCPTQAIVSGDLDDPDSHISRLVSRHNVTVRKPEQGTLPKLFYIEADEVTLSPTSGMAPASLAFSELVSEQDLSGPARERGHADGSPASARTAVSGHALRSPSAMVQGAPGYERPIHLGGGAVAGHMVQTSYTAQHKVPWHWQVPAYLVTKAIGSGAMMWLTLLFGLGLIVFDRTLAIVGALTALAGIGATTALLVADLEKPGRFLSVLTRPQWRSWLARGAYILVAFTVVVGLWVLLEALAGAGLVGEGLVGGLRPLLLWNGGILALLAAIYTAYLFGQAEGRDLWQSTLLPGHLAIQALMAGAAGLLLVGWVILPGLGALMPGLLGAVGGSAPLWFGEATRWLGPLLLGTLVIDLGLTLGGELGMPHASANAARAAHEIRHGRWTRHFWGGSVIVGHVLPLSILVGIAAGWVPDVGPLMMLLLSAATLAVLIGLYFYETAFVMAPQEVPNS